MKTLLMLLGSLIPDWLLFLLPLIALLLVIQGGKWLYNRYHKRLSHHQSHRHPL